jgi:hypothetical protein
MKIHPSRSLSIFTFLLIVSPRGCRGCRSLPGGVERLRSLLWAERMG